jgi:hypothetical protein
MLTYFHVAHCVEIAGRGNSVLASLRERLEGGRRVRFGSIAIRDGQLLRGCAGRV